MQPKTQGDLYANFEFSLHSSLFSDAPLHKFYSLLSLQTLICLPSSAILHTVLKLSFFTSWSRKYIWQKAGRIIEHPVSLSWLVVSGGHSSPSYPNISGSKIQSISFLLDNILFLAYVFRSFCLFKHWKHFYIVPDNSNIRSLVCLIFDICFHSLWCVFLKFGLWANIQLVSLYGNPIRSGLRGNIFREDLCLLLLGHSLGSPDLTGSIYM